MNKLLLAILLALPALARGADAPAPAPAAPAPNDGKLQDVVIKSDDKEEPSSTKPPLDIPVDPYESLRSTLKPDESWLLAQSPVLVSWVRSRPDRLKDEHVIEPWNDSLTELSEVKLPLQEELSAALGRAPSGKELKSSWSVSIVDEEGKPIRKFDGTGVPDHLAWNGLSDQGDWLRAGHAYSAVYKFSDSTTTARTVLGQPIQFPGLVRKEGDGKLIGLDSSALFGVNRQDRAVGDGGKVLLRAAADWVRRHAFGSPLLLRVYGPDAPTAQAQAASAKTYLRTELGLPAEAVAYEAAVASAADQRVDLLVGGR